MAVVADRVRRSGMCMTGNDTCYLQVTTIRPTARGSTLSRNDESMTLTLHTLPSLPVSAGLL